MAWRGLCLATAMVAGGESVGAQRLWSIEDVSTRVPPVVLQGVAVSPAIAAGTGASTVQTATIRVEFDYLRLGMGYLELPLANGAVIAAENAVFEDRGNGNLMWTGEVPGAGYESVLFTVQDGHLVGWFGVPGGPKHTVHAGPDGRGSFSIETGPVGDWCRAEAGPRGDEVRGAAATPHRLEPAVSGSNGGSLDILLLYSEGTARWWRDIGGPAVGVQQLADYLNMVFRNGAVPATANLIPVEWTPERSPHPDTKGGHYLWNGFAEMWHQEFEFSPTVEALKRRHKPDLVHFIASLPGANAVGVAQLLTTTLDPAVLTGWSMPFPGIFAHEIGHNLGGRHEPATFGDGFASVQQEALRPHAFGHTDLTSCGDPRYDYGELLACPTTIMSYGQETWADPQILSVREPFYSSVRHKPNGWTIGVAGEREVERLLHETVPLSMRNSEAPIRAARFPRRMTVHWSGPAAARVAWEGTFDTRHTNFLCSAWAGGSREVCWSVNAVDTGTTVEGLRPGGRYRFWFHRGDDLAGGLVVELAPPDFNGRAPAAPTDVSLIAAGPDGVRLGWRGESPAGGFEIWCQKWSSAGFPDLPSLAWERCGPPLGPGARSAEIDGLVAEEDLWITEDGATTPKGRYSFVVVAQNDSGFSASETIDYEFMPGPFPPPTAAGVVPDCALRSSGLTLDGRTVVACVETPAGERRRAWSYELGSDRSGLLYFFDRDNVELLVKVLDGCAINGHHWVFVAPVTDLGFRLRITNPGGWYGPDRPVHWSYDFERRPNREILWDRVGNPKGATARTVSDTTAFPCTEAEIAAAREKAAEASGGHAAFLRSRGVTADRVASAQRVSAGARTDCEPGRTALTLAGGYKVRMCYDTYAGETGEALDYGLDSSQSGLLYFFDRDNAEVLVKVLDGCAINGHRWVFVAPVTDLGFALRIEGPASRVWTHRNALGQVAETASDLTAFPCG
ncbi:MAG: hypothetical protein OXH70_14000 [Acidobacteria bacterium]|nr:hypothetical protein [Acidobacteriota bacterium]